MGTWYTVIAGLLNILVIYDAYGGPLAVPISGRKKESEENKQGFRRRIQSGVGGRKSARIRGMRHGRGATNFRQVAKNFRSFVDFRCFPSHPLTCSITCR